MALIYPKDLCQLLVESDKCTFSMIDFTQPVYEDETMYRYVNVSKEKGYAFCEVYFYKIKIFLKI